MKINTLIALFLSLLIGCSSSPETTNKNESVSPSKTVKTNKLDITIPMGWRQIEDNTDKIFELWLINDLNNASIAFTPIHLNNFYSESLEEKVNIISDISIKKRESAFDDFELLTKKNFSINKLFIEEVRYLINDKIQNLLIVSNGKHFYECIAYFKKDYDPNSSEIENLIETQKQTINSLVIH